MGKQNLKWTDLKTFWRLVQYAKPYWWRLAVGMLAAIFGSGSLVALFIGAQAALSFFFKSTDQLGSSEPAPAAIEAPAVPEAPAEAETGLVARAADGLLSADDASSSESSSSFKAWVDRQTRKNFGKFMDEDKLSVLQKRGVSGLVYLALVMMLFIIVNSVSQFVGTYYLEWVGQRVVMDLRVRLFRHMQELSLSFFNATRSGDMISRTVADTQLLQTTVTNVIADTIRQPVKVLAVFAFIVVFEWRLALYSLALVPTIVLPIVLIGRRLRRISREGQRKLADLTSVMKESLDGVSVVKAFGQEERESEQFRKQCYGFFRMMVRATKAKAFNDPINHFIGGLGGMVILIFATVTGMPISKCVIFAGALFFLYEPIKRLGRISMDIQQSSGAADRVFEILDAPVTVREAPDARPVEGALETIELRDVDFAYGEKEVFRKMNLTIRAGESLAIVGPSGGGKTTLVGLLERFFDPTAGVVLRNGVDLREFSFSSLRGNIGLVLQDTFLFNATIAENIAFGKPDATREEIEAAAKLAHAHEFIMAKENGYDTVVGERGVSLSGGQKQRLAIARALIRKPEMLILDEATSALDTDSERAVQAAIDGLMERLTVVVIAHRLSTIAKCRHVAVVANGGVAEYGTHEELLRNPDGIFTHLHSLQFEAPKF